jgi:hypothetical protein
MATSTASLLVAIVGYLDVIHYCAELDRYAIAPPACRCLPMPAGPVHGCCLLCAPTHPSTFIHRIEGTYDLEDMVEMVRGRHQVWSAVPCNLTAHLLPQADEAKQAAKVVEKVRQVSPAPYLCWCPCTLFADACISHTLRCCCQVATQ